MSRAALYRRVSTASQVDGFSLGMQLETLSQLAERQGFEWDDFCDPGRSGEKLEERPALMDMLGRLDQFDALFVVDESRLARSEGVAFAIRAHLREAGVKLVTLTGETDLGDPEESTMSAVRTLFAVAEQYRRTERMTGALDRAASEGLWTGGPAPYGYRRVPTPTGHTTLEVEPGEAEVLHRLIGMVLDEGDSVYQAAKRLNAEGYRTRSGGAWSYRNLAHHLKRRHLVGEIPYQSTNGPVARQYPPLVSQERYEALQTVLRRTARPAPRKAHTYPFSGRVACECGGRLVGTYRNDRDTRYYVCNRTTNGAPAGQRCTATPRSRQAGPFEELLWEPIRATLSDPERLTAAALDHTTQPQSDPAILEKEIRTHQRRLEAIRVDRIRTFRDARDLGLTDRETRDLLGQLADEADQIDRQLATLEGRLQVSQDTPNRLQTATRLTEMAAARLDAPTLDTQAQFVALLDIQVALTPDGYLVSGSIPLDPGQGLGKIRTTDPRDP